MSEFTLTKTRLFEGVWEGVLSREGETTRQPKIIATHLGETLPDVNVTHREESKDWIVQVPIPADRIADGVQTFLIHELEDDAMLGSFTLVAGEAMAYDIRAEVTLLREELDMLKRAFRRHCLETM